MIEKLPDDLAALFEAERAARPAPGMRTAVRAKLTASAAGGATAAGMGFKLIVGLAIIIGGGTAVYLATRSTSEPTPATALVHERVQEAALVPVPAAAPLPAVMPTPAPAKTSAHVANRHHKFEPEPEPVRPAPVPIADAQLLARAWRLLPSDPNAALALVDPTAGGPLAEERDAIRSVALAQLHRPEAQDALAQFLSAHPRSLHRALVERAQKGLP